MDASLQISGGLNINRERSVRPYSTGIYLLNVNNRNSKRSCGICSKLTINTPD